MGTGTPILDAQRPATTSLLIDHAGVNLLVDVGRGTTMRLLEHGLTPTDLDAIFVTHHHYDHICDLGEVMLTGWHNGRTAPLAIYGPPRTAQIVDALLTQVFAQDIMFSHVLAADTPDIRSIMQVTEIAPENVADWQLAGTTWQMTAGLVNHGNSLGLPVSQWCCLGYKFKTADTTLVIAGDAVANDDLITFSQRADALVISCYLSEQEVRDMNAEQLSEHVIASSHQVARLATEARVNKLILTHFRTKSAKLMAALAEEVAAVFSGEVILAEESMGISLEA
ncbi:MAG: MBL fold metallo-hydrolase [Deinococcota bacterium]